MTNGYSCANSFLWDSPPKSLPQIERRPMSRPASPTTACQKFALFRGWQNLLNTDLINEVFAFQVDQLCTLFVVGQMRPNPLLITITVIDHSCPSSSRAGDGHFSLERFSPLGLASPRSQLPVRYGCGPAVTQANAGPRLRFRRMQLRPDDSHEGAWAWLDRNAHRPPPRQRLSVLRMFPNSVRKVVTAPHSLITPASRANARMSTSRRRAQLPIWSRSQTYNPVAAKRHSGNRSS
jgi:hypothetical protein